MKKVRIYEKTGKNELDKEYHLILNKIVTILFKKEIDNTILLLNNDVDKKYNNIIMVKLENKYFRRFLIFYWLYKIL